MMKREKNVVYGPEPKHPLGNFTAGEMLYNALHKHSHIPQAILDVMGNESLSYQEFFDTTVKLGQSLQNCGYKMNDVVSICAENNKRFFIPIISAWYIGMIVAPVNEDYIPDELCKVTGISKPILVFTTRKILPKVLEVKDRTNYIKRIIILDSEENLLGCESLHNFMSRYSDNNLQTFKPLHYDPVDQVAAILCSSGTTGLPKGVMQTHRNICVRLTHASDPRVGTQLIPGVSVLAYLPFFHAFGFSINLGYFMVGLRVVMLRRFNQEVFLKAIQDYEVRSVINVPSTILFLSKSPLVDKYDLSTLAELCCGAAPLAKEVAEIAVKRLNLPGIRCGYGLTESTSANIHTLHNEFKSGSLGKVTPYMAAKIIDRNTGEALGPNQVGELCIWGPMVTKGYVNNPQATKEAIDDDGWLHSGDFGYYDEDEYFYIVDRYKELIKYKGYQVAPVELEEILLQHPGIRDVAVVGIPDIEAGELPAGFVVKQPGAQLTAKEVYDFLAQRVSHSKYLRGGVRFVDSIPRNVTGKISRKELREALMEKASKL